MNPVNQSAGERGKAVPPAGAAPPDLFGQAENLTLRTAHRIPGNQPVGNGGDKGNRYTDSQFVVKPDFRSYNGLRVGCTPRKEMAPGEL